MQTAFTAIDTHAHVMRRDAPLASERHSAPKRDVTVEEYLSVLDAHSVSHGVLTAPSFYGTDNTILVDALRFAPTRLRGTAIVAPDIDDAALRELDANGVVGIRLNWVKRSSLPDPTADGYPRLFERIRELGWHIEVYLEGPKLARVLPQLRASGARVVVDHFGGPDPQLQTRCAGFQALLTGVRAGDTWVKLSAAYRQGGVDPQRYVDALLATGADQLVWASDWPFVSFEDKISYRQCVDSLQAWVPDESVRRRILVDTPRELFRFDRALNR
ncbi:MAG TPA: amidohydrolase family protein [Casimicrobiaceae bacterium]|nr:amidohydrolase family protein [Casimicrobiaceae bacterium]